MRDIQTDYKDEWHFPKKLLSYGIIAIASAGLTFALTNPKEPPPKEIQFRPTVQSLEQLAKIVTLKVHLADTLMVDARRSGSGTVKAAWIIKGDALVGVDVANAVIEIINDDAKRASILLPEPEVISPRVDHEKTRTFNLVTGTWTSDDYIAYITDKAMRIAQEKIGEQAQDPEHIEMARDRAERIIKGFYGVADWTIDIKWQGRQQSE